MPREISQATKKEIEDYKKRNTPKSEQPIHSLGMQEVEDWEESFEKEIPIGGNEVFDKLREDIKSFIRSAIRAAIEKVDICKQCGDKDVVCKKGVQEQIFAAVAKVVDDGGEIFEQGREMGAKEERSRILEEMDFLIAEECNQARKDGFPTSRLTSLAMKLKDYV